MGDEWATWCRLCGKVEVAKDSIMNISNDLIQILRKCFSIELISDVKYPTIACADCLKFSIKCQEFSKQCVKVDNMFHLLITQKESSTNKSLINVRYEYGIDFNNYDYNHDPQGPMRYIISSVSDHPLDTERVEAKTDTHVNGTSQMNRKRKINLIKRKVDEKAQMKFEELKDIKRENIDNELNDLEDSGIAKEEIHEDKDETDSLNWYCPVCSESFDKARLRNVHLKQEHGHITRPFKCDLCPKTFPTARHLKLHGNTHLPDNEKMVHKCPYCNKCFSKSVNATAHIQYIHVANRNFICEECGKSFITKGGLKEHYLTHSEDRPYQCTSCPKTFKNYQQMKIHEDIHSEIPVECKICNKKLNTKKTLREHMIVHSDLKNHKCHICGNEYKRRKTLKTHLATHTGKPFMCQYCDKTFQNDSNYSRHKKKCKP